jgi:hypothetical protein
MMPAAIRARYGRCVAESRNAAGGATMHDDLDVDLGPHLDLPKLPTMDVVLYTTVVKPAARAAVNTLSAVIHTIV